MKWTIGHLGAAVVLVASFTACDSGGDRGGDAVSAQDSVATVRELRSSLEGGQAPGKQSYSYRGLYAGMTRAALEKLLSDRVSAAPAACTAAVKPASDTTCTYEAALGPDSARVTVTATYTREPSTAEWLAREIAVARALPIAVDGVQVARGLSDAFEQQTVLLDSRDASYGHHTAVIRMGTLRGERQNFAAVTVAPKNGREELTVTLTRMGAAPRVAAPAASATPRDRKKPRP
jgi:hypothetical protein